MIFFCFSKVVGKMFYVVKKSCCDCMPATVQNRIKLSCSVLSCSVVFYSILYSSVLFYSILSVATSYFFNQQHLIRENITN